MLPMLLLIGFVLAVTLPDQRSLRVAVPVALVASVLWGVVVGVIDGSLRTVAGGTALGVANLLAGAAVAALVRTIAWSWRRLGRAIAR